MRAVTVAWALAVIGFVFSWQAVPGFASEFSFNAQLSLTGDCSTSPLDSVPDPGLCPGVAGTDHPALPFTRPQGVATDSSGDVYVSSSGKSSAGGAEGRIDIFSPSGLFISELEVGGGPRFIAVDPEGVLYVMERGIFSGGPKRISRCAPTTYQPLSEEISYGSCVVAVPEHGPPATLPDIAGIAVNPTDGHLFVSYQSFVAEFGSAEEGNPLLDEIGNGALGPGRYVAIDAAHGRIYASYSNQETLAEPKVRVFALAAPHELLETVSGCGATAFRSAAGEEALAVDESNGHFYVGDLPAKSRVYEFGEGYECLETIKHSFQDAGPSAITVDNSPTSPNRRDLFVTSGETEIGHSYVFEPVVIPQPPVIKSATVGEVDETEAQLEARIDSGGAETAYAVEYMTRQAFEEAGETFTGATIAAEGQIAANAESFEVLTSASSLQPGTEYVFKVRAESGLGTDEMEGIFGTFPEVGSLGRPCTNEALRSGASGALPDCRAYELVTPADTNGHAPTGGKGSGAYFSPTLLTSPAGDRTSFMAEGGALPGFEAAGGFSGDDYVASRGVAGWQTELAGPTGSESQAPVPGSFSPDQEFNFWAAGGGKDEGSAVINHDATTYVRYPDGHSELIGRGNLGADPRVEPDLITEGGGHIVFTTISVGSHVPQQLEEDAPPEGTTAVYDRTADEVTHVVSLLPGDVTPTAGQNAKYEGASPGGSGIAFSLGGTLYLRVDNSETFEVAEGAAFAGIANGGTRIFYVKGGDLFAFDAATEETIPFSESGDVTAVNVGAGGTGTYFVSPSKLTGEEESEASPNGSFPQAGAENLYLSEEGQLSFVGTVTEADVEGGVSTPGLGRWTQGIAVITGTSVDPSRSTAGGGILLFESRADLAGFKSGGKAQIYRYDKAAGTLLCLSCSPSLAAPGGDASLQSADSQSGDDPLGSSVLVPNLRADGARAFFQTPEPLVAADTDKRLDVYEWEEGGVGSCAKPGGCIYLVSSPHSPRAEYLYAVSASGDDVFFISSKALVPSDTGQAASIYDARVGGGFAEEPEITCESEGTCRTPLTAPPAFAPPLTQGSGTSGQPKTSKPKKCPKGTRKVRRHGQVRCIKKHRHHHQRATSRRGAGR